MAAADPRCAQPGPTDDDVHDHPGDHDRATDNGGPDDGSANDASANDASANDASADDSAAADASADDSAADDGSANDSAAANGSANHRGPANGSANDSAADDGSVDERAENDNTGPHDNRRSLVVAMVLRDPGRTIADRDRSTLDRPIFACPADDGRGDDRPTNDPPSNYDDDQARNLHVDHDTEESDRLRRSVVELVRLLSRPRSEGSYEARSTNPPIWGIEPTSGDMGDRRVKGLTGGDGGKAGGASKAQPEQDR